MKVLFVLIVAFILTTAIARGVSGVWHLLFSGNLAMCLMLCMTALGHFKFAAGMEMMIPDFIPFKKEVVLLTGIAEVALGLALLFPAARTIAGMLLVLLFVLMLPANIHAAVKHINFEKGDYSGAGLSYLWFRIPLQVLFIAWIWFFSIRS